MTPAESKNRIEKIRKDDEGRKFIEGISGSISLPMHYDIRFLLSEIDRRDEALRDIVNCDPCCDCANIQGIALEALGEE